MRNVLVLAVTVTLLGASDPVDWIIEDRSPTEEETMAFMNAMERMIQDYPHLKKLDDVLREAGATDEDKRYRMIMATGRLAGNAFHAGALAAARSAPNVRWLLEDRYPTKEEVVLHLQALARFVDEYRFKQELRDRLSDAGVTDVKKASGEITGFVRHAYEEGAKVVTKKLGGISR